MRMARTGVLAAAWLVMAIAGCAGDVVTQVTRNSQVRDRVMTAFASNGALAEQMTRRLLANDSLRTRVVETVLNDSPSAQYVLDRIGHNTGAVDYVLQAALSDSIGRAHVVALMEQIRKALAPAR